MNKVKRPLVIIPTHLESVRLPNKPLLKAGNKTLLQRTYDAARTLFDTVVLTSDEQVHQHCLSTGMECFITPKVDIPTGTHRIAKYIHDIRSDDNYVNNYDWFINWQVDEPFVDSEDVMLLYDQKHPDEIGTLVSPITHSERNDSNVVKVVWLPDGSCLWFTRAAIMTKYAHVGVYLYHRKALEFFYSMGRNQTSYAYNEKLEQLNWLERSPQYTIVGRLVEDRPLSINTEKDWEKFKAIKEDFDVD